MKVTVLLAIAPPLAAGTGCRKPDTPNISIVRPQPTRRAMTRIVTTSYRYEPPTREKKPVTLEVPAVRAEPG